MKLQIKTAPFFHDTITPIIVKKKKPNNLETHTVTLLVLTQMERIAKINGLDRLDKTVVEAARQSLVIGQL